MADTLNSLEAVKLIGDWGKWLVTIETAIIATIGAFMTAATNVPQAAKVFGTLAVVSFAASILAASMLLATLPEITQNLRSDQNIWLTRDSVAGRTLHMNTQAFAAVESLAFWLGLVLSVAMIIAFTWS